MSNKLIAFSRCEKVMSAIEKAGFKDQDSWKEKNGPRHEVLIEGDPFDIAKKIFNQGERAVWVTLTKSVRLLAMNYELSLVIKLRM